MPAQRTAAEIRAYCEAASDGPWCPAIDKYESVTEMTVHVAAGLQHSEGTDLYLVLVGMNQDEAEALIEGHEMGKDVGIQTAAIVGNGPNGQANMEFIVNARADLPAVLDAAVTERDVLETLMYVARGISKSAATGHPLARWEIMQLDDAIMGAGKVIDETKWLKEQQQCKYKYES